MALLLVQITHTDYSQELIEAYGLSNSDNSDDIARHMVPLC